MVKALKELWSDACDVTVRRSEIDERTGRTVFTEETICSGIPCRVSFKISFETVSSTKDQGMAHTLSQSVKLFIDKDIQIPPGSRITVYREGRAFEFARSGAAAVFSGHQEIRLESWKGWA